MEDIAAPMEDAAATGDIDDVDAYRMMSKDVEEDADVDFNAVMQQAQAEAWMHPELLHAAAEARDYGRAVTQTDKPE